MTRLLVVILAVAGLSARMFGQAASPDTISDAEILRQFEQRRDITLERAVGHVEGPHIDTRFTVAADFYSRTNLDWANRELPKIYSTKPRDIADVFWMYPLATIMEAGSDDMSATNRTHIRDLWRTCFPFRMDTENHWLLYYTSLCLAAEANPGAGPEAWYNGKSSAENIAEARSYIEDWMDITTAYGQGEFESPSYFEEYVEALALLAGWERDPQFRQEAHMMLDYMSYDYAVEQLNGELGGAHSRVYPAQVVQPGETPAAAIGWLMFGLGDYQMKGSTLILAMSGYEPPPILYRIAHNRAQPYVNRELKRTRWRIRHPGPNAFAIEGKSTVPVYNYTYMDPDFVIGSCQGGLLQPIQQQSWSLIWSENKVFSRENTFFGLQPYSSGYEGTMYFGGVTPDNSTYLIAHDGPSAKADYDSPDKLEGGSPYEDIFQEGPALIALYDIPTGARFPIIDTFFSRDLAHRDPDKSGWIFCQGGPVYFGYRPLAPGTWRTMGWTGLLQSRNDSWFSGGYLNYGRNNLCLVSSSLKNGYIVQVAPARSYRSFENFKAAVRALPVHFTLEPAPEVTFTGLDGKILHARYGGVFQVNGNPVDYTHWPLFDSPYGHASRASERLEIDYGQERYLLNFKNTEVDDEQPPAEL
jgi:hypothetical protein